MADLIELLREILARHSEVLDALLRLIELIERFFDK